MTNEKLLKATENQIKMTDKLIVDLIREFQNYVDPGDEPLMTAPDLKDALTAVVIKEQLLLFRGYLLGLIEQEASNMDFELRPEVTE